MSVLYRILVQHIAGNSKADCWRFEDGDTHDVAEAFERAAAIELRGWCYAYVVIVRGRMYESASKRSQVDD